MNAAHHQATDSFVMPLRCANLHKSYDQAVLQGIDLTLEPGTVLGLLGRNGAGKTTLIRILMGLLAPSSGSAWVFGQPAMAMGDGAKDRLGYVPQHPEALNRMQVDEMLGFISRFYPRWDHEYVASTLLRWNISSSRLLSKLSDGERQQVALIRALATRPQLLILDEPAAALDPVVRRELLREIALRAADDATTVLYSTHLVSDLERIASHVCMLHRGRVRLHAALDELQMTHLRWTVPPQAAGQLPVLLHGELSRRRRSDGSLSLVLSQIDGHWPNEMQRLDGRQEPLHLEDLFIEIAT